MFSSSALFSFMTQERMYRGAGNNNNNSAVISLVAASRKTFCYPVRMFPHVKSACDAQVSVSVAHLQKKGKTSVHGKWSAQAVERLTFL